MSEDVDGTRAAIRRCSLELLYYYRQLRYFAVPITSISSYDWYTRSSRSCLSSGVTDYEHQNSAHLYHIGNIVFDCTLVEGEEKPGIDVNIALSCHSL